MKIISNLKNYNEYLEIYFPLNGEIRKVVSEILKNIDDNENIYFLKILTTGRRILNNQNFEDLLNLINGRKHRCYLAFKIKNKIIIKFAWYKIKYLTLKEKEFIKQNWHLNFFNQEGKFLVKQLNGVVFPEYILNKYFT